MNIDSRLGGAAKYEAEEFIRGACSFIRPDGGDPPLTPGMAITTEVKTGKRRVIEYFLRPSGVTATRR